MPVRDRGRSSRYSAEDATPPRRYDTYARENNTGMPVRDSDRIERYSVADTIPPPKYDTYSTADTVGRAYAIPPPRYDTYSTSDTVDPAHRRRNALLERIEPDYYSEDTERKCAASGFVLPAPRMRFVILSLCGSRLVSVLAFPRLRWFR